MKRDKALLEKRSEFVMTYLKENSSKRMTSIVSELSERLFLTERTIYTIIDKGIGSKRPKKQYP